MVMMIKREGSFVFWKLIMGILANFLGDTFVYKWIPNDQFALKLSKMAMLNGNNASLVPKSQIEAMQSVSAMRMTEPRRMREVSVLGSRSWEIFRRCLHVILYYKLEGGDQEWSGWLVAGWLKESLGRALTEQPLPSGRLRRSEEGGDKMEIVSNDSSCRLVEARMSMTLSEFLDLRAREEAEDELVFWQDIDEQNPQFSPLFYVQVTNFECGGYSIGISCSLLLVDLFVIKDFLKRWANVHNNMVSKIDVPKTPIFYLPNLKLAGGAPMSIIGSNQTGSRGRSMVFEIDTKNLNLSSDELVERVSLLCIREAEHKLGVKMDSNFTMFVIELPSENIKIGSHSKQGVIEEVLKISSGVISASWEDLGGNEVAFQAGNEPKHISHWISSDSGEGLVVLIPFHNEGISGMKIIVTLPSEN